MTSQDFNALPEGCVATILSLGTPREACQLSLVSPMFRSAAESDVVWERFLPSNIQSILSKSVSPIVFSSKKELFFHLQHPIHLNGGHKIFALERLTGKITYMLSARELSIAGSDDATQWIWTSPPKSNFSDSAELISTSMLEIQGKIQTNTLSPRTTYVAYLIIKITDCAYGLDALPSEISVEVGNKVSRGTAYLRRNDTKKQRLQNLYYSNRGQMLKSRVIEGVESIAKERNDGWMEIKLGEFFTGSDAEVKMSLMEIKGGQLKCGLVIEGIEFKPKM